MTRTKRTRILTQRPASKKKPRSDVKCLNRSFQNTSDQCVGFEMLQANCDNRSSFLSTSITRQEQRRLCKKWWRYKHFNSFSTLHHLLYLPWFTCWLWKQKPLLSFVLVFLIFDIIIAIQLKNIRTTIFLARFFSHIFHPTFKEFLSWATLNYCNCIHHKCIISKIKLGKYWFYLCSEATLCVWPVTFPWQSLKWGCTARLEYDGAVEKDSSLYSCRALLYLSGLYPSAIQMVHASAVIEAAPPQTAW